jgi:hypothetical protein
VASRPIKLPVVITTDGTQAQAGFAKLRQSLGGLDRIVGKHLGQQAARLTGMFSSFFTIDALISGITRVLQHGQDVIDRVSQFSAPAVESQARLEAAQLKQDVQIASVIGPDIAKTAKQKEQLLPQTGMRNVAAASLANTATQVYDRAVGQYTDLFTGDFDSFIRKGVENLQFYYDYYTGGGEKDLTDEQIMRASGAIPEPAAGSAEEAQAALAELQEHTRQLRELNQRLRGS